MIGINGKKNNDLSNLNSEILILVDSSSNLDEIQKTFTKSNTKIISFDYKSHKLLSSKNIKHIISDNFLIKDDIEKIRNSSYVFSKWYNEKSLTSIISYKNVNLGQLYYPEFHYFLVPFLKFFLEIHKIFSKYPESYFYASGMIFNIIKSLTENCEEFKITTNDKEFLYDSIDVPIKLGNYNKTLHFSRSTYKKIKNISDNAIHLFFHPQNNKDLNKILLIESDVIKYNKLFLAFSQTDLSPICYNRRRPTIWNKETFSIIRKSKCKIITSNALNEKGIKQNIKNDIENYEEKLNQIDNSFMSTFFTINGTSFWDIIKPLFIKLGKKRISDGIFEINLASKLLKQHNFKTILLWSEHGFTEQIILQLTNNLKINTVLVQHGLYYDTKSALDFNKFIGVLPNYSDYIIVWGNILANYAIECGVPKNKIQILGNPIYDTIFQNIVTENKKYILLATPPITKNYVDDLTIKTQENFENAVKTVCEKAKKLNMSIIIKSHPFIGEFDLEKLVKDIDPNIPVIRTSSITPLIQSCEVLVTFDISTIILEAQILKKPVISIDIRDHLYGDSEIISSQSCVSTTISNFDKSLDKVLNDNSFRDLLIKRGSRFIQNYLQNQGLSINEHLKFLEKI